MARNSAKNHTQPELAIPVGDPSGKARRMSSGNVVRRATWVADLNAQIRIGLLRQVLDQSNDISDLARKLEQAIWIASRLNENQLSLGLSR
jgi:hypothetical protein